MQPGSKSPLAIAATHHEPAMHDHTGILIAAVVSALIWGAILLLVI